MKILIVGCGSIGVRHANVINSTGKHQLVLCDPNETFLNALAQQTGATELYRDFEVAIKESHADAAIVCTPNHLHAAPTILALQNGMHVLCEKPIASSVEDARAMADAAKENKKTLMVGYTMRANPIITKIKDILRSETLGRLSSARVILAAPETLTCAKSSYRQSYKTGGGIVYDYSHELDYCQYFFGNAEKCVAFVDSLFPELPTCDDNAALIVKYQSGITVTYHMDYVQEKGATRGRSIAIVFENGFLETNFSTELTVFCNNGNTEKYSYHYERDDLFLNQLTSFEALIAGKAVDHCSGEDGYEVIQLCHKLYESAEKESVVRL